MWRYNGREEPRSLTNNSRFQVHKDGSGNMFTGSGLTEERVEGVVPSSDSLVTGHLAIGLDAVFQAVELPACIANLSSSLANVNRDALTLCAQVVEISKTSMSDPSYRKNR